MINAVVGIDIGGTSTKFGIIDKKGKLAETPSIHINTINSINFQNICTKKFKV